MKNLKHILSINDFSLDQMHCLFEYASFLEEKFNAGLITNVLNGAVLANLFFEPSTRTRLSFHAAFARLGGQVMTLSTNTSFEKGESIEDSARVISRYSDVVVVRHRESNWIKKYTAFSDVPVINGGNGSDEHPTQALLDLYTIHKILKTSDWKLEKKKIIFTGDLKNSRTVHSLLIALKHYRNIEIIAFAEEKLQLPSFLMDNVLCTDDPLKLKNADILYVTRLQKERGSCAKIPTIDRVFFDKYLNNNIKIMHPLPRVNELSITLDSYPGFKVFDQVGYGIPIRMALFLKILHVQDIVFSHKTWNVYS